MGRVRYAAESDAAAIKKLHRDVQGERAGYTEFYLKNVFDVRRTLIYEEGNRIVAAIDVIPHQISLGGRRIGVNRFAMISSLAEAKNLGYEKELFEAALDMSDRQVLVTLIGADEVPYAKDYAFQPRFIRQDFAFEKKFFPRYGTSGVTTHTDEKDMESLYNRFASHFQGYYVSEEGKMQNLLKRAEEEHAQVYSYYNGENLEGYYISYITNDTVIVDEIVYENGEALARMLSHASDKKPNIVVRASGSERLDKVIPYAKTEKYPETLVRINDKALFRKCFQLGKTESFKTVWGYKALYQHEKY